MNLPKREIDNKWALLCQKPNFLSISQHFNEKTKIDDLEYRASFRILFGKFTQDDPQSNHHG